MNLIRTGGLSKSNKKESILYALSLRYNLFACFRVNPYRITAFVFIGFIFVFGGLTSLLNIKGIAYQTFIGYKKSLPEQATVSEHIRGMINGVESSVNNGFYAKDFFVPAYGLLQRLMGKNVVADVNPNNTVAKDSSGKLHFVQPKLDMKGYIQSISGFKTYFAGSGTKFIYIQAPFKVLDGYTRLPAGIEDYSNRNTDEFLQGLEQYNIDYLDLRREIRKDVPDKNRLFFNTDHHWTTETAFWGFTKVINKLNSSYVFGADEFYTDIKNYNRKVFENCFLGSQGKRVGRFFGGVDDYTLITPGFATHLTVTTEHSADKAEKCEGDFSQAFIKEEFLDMSESINKNRYCAYLGGDYALIRIENKDVKNDKKVLMIKDSFADNFIPFLSLTVKKLDVIDLRVFKQQTLKEYLDNNSYDIVMFLYNPGAYHENEELFDFGW